jgi:outer membrane murein-binding lipoprotein Lpp
MKKLFYIILSLCILAGGCQKYDDTELRSDIDDLKERVQNLESLCQNLNKDIVALKALVEALQANDYIVSVTPNYEGSKETGYIITFGSGKSITIYHGSDGKDGEDGATPVIGVRQDTDGVYYWTIDGEWLLDDSGHKVKAVGKDGVTPQLKIEDGMWYVSYDSGDSWHEVGPATGERGAHG